MNWKYSIKKVSDIDKEFRDSINLEVSDGYIIIEDYGNDSYAVLNDPYELWGQTRDDIIERLELMLKDLKG